MRADSSAASIMEGGLRGGGYGPTLNFPTIFPSHSLAAAAAAAAAAAPTAAATGAPLAYIPAAAASATRLTTRSTFRILMMLDMAVAHDLQCAVCEWYRSRSSSLVVCIGGSLSSNPAGHAGCPPAISEIQRRNATT